MKPEKLTMCAFASYRNKIEIDFAALGDANVCLVCGDTGAGKTTLFDGICYALYGKPSGAYRDINQLRCTAASPYEQTFVQLQFLFRNVRYLVRRTPTQRLAKKNSDAKNDKAPSLTERPTTAEFCRIAQDGKVEVIASKPSLVNDEIVKLLGLDAAQFCQIAMISQGEFSKLLFANTNDHKAILRKLFHTAPYDRLQQALLDEERNTKAICQKHRDDVISAMTSISCGEGDAFYEPLQLAKASCYLSDTFLRQLTEFLESDQQHITTAKAESDGLHKQLELVNQQIGEAGRIEHIRHALQKTCADLAVQQQAQQDAQRALADQEKQKPHRDALQNDIYQLEQHQLPTFAALQTAQDARDLHRKTLDAQTQKRDAGAAQYKKTIAQMEQNQISQNALREAPAQLQAAEQHKKEYAATKEQLLDLQTRLAAYQREQTAYAQAQKAFATAEAHRTALQKAYDEHYHLYLCEQAGILAQALTEGEACPVCGATSHPQPASLSQKVLTQEQLQAEEQTVKNAADDAAQKSNHCHRLDASVTAQKGEVIAQGNKLLGVDTLEVLPDSLAQKSAEISHRLGETEHELTRLRDEVRTLHQLIEQLPLLQNETERLQAEQTACTEALHATTLEITSKESAIAALQKNITHPSKAAAMVCLTQKQTELRTLDAALDNATKAYQTHREQASALDGQKQGLENQLVAAPSFDSDALQAQQTALSTLAQERLDTIQRLTTRKEQNTLFAKKLQTAQALYETTNEKLQWLSSLARTASGTIPGKAKLGLETYAQASYFSRILQRANVRLMAMSHGRYSLQRRNVSADGKGQSGLEINVVDMFNNTERPVKTLSGGESFQASLALALGLSDEIQSNAGGVQLDTMFIDEGFGSLDSTARTQAIQSLTDLADGERTVFIISHISELKDAIETQLHVKKTELGSTVQLTC